MQGTGGDLQHYQPDRTTRIMSYNVRIECTDSVREFLEAYGRLLQRAIDEIWNNISWCEKVIKVERPVPIPVSDRKRILPKLPMNNGFRRRLRNMLLRDWAYAAHYVDSALKQAYSIMKSWRRGYISGDCSRDKPTVRKRFARIKQTLYTYRDGKMRITIRPYKEYIELDISRAWFWSRVPNNAEMGELILRDGWLTITFKYEGEMPSVRDLKKYQRLISRYL